MTNLKPQQLAKLAKASTKATENCSKVMSKWAGQTIEIHMDRIDLVPFEDVIPRLEPLDGLSYGLYLALSEDLEGNLLFLLSEPTAVALADTLMGHPPGAVHALSEMEHSALLETANIVGTSFINALVKELNVRKILPGPPSLLHDITQSIIDSVLLEHSQKQNRVILAQMRFTSSAKTLEWKFFFLPKFEKIAKLL